MLKITRRLFRWDPKPEYADYYERALLNHVLCSQNPETGMVCYYVPLKTGSRKQFSTPNDAFWCCVGTGMESHAKYGDSIYFHDGQQTLYVNLFIASELNWAERGLKLRQQTRFPREDTTRLTWTCDKPVELAVKVRHPYWATSGFRIAVNGEIQPGDTKPGTYFTLARQWKSGDVVEVKMPMSLRTESFRDNPRKLAILYGPMVLCAALEPGKPFPAIVGQVGDIVPAIKRVEGRRLSFACASPPFKVLGSEGAGGLTLVPFYREYQKPYIVYWDVLDEAQWQARQKQLQEEQARHKALESRTVDRVLINDEDSEHGHDLQGEKHGAGEFGGRMWRHAGDGGWFSYRMKVPADKPAELLCAYWGSDVGPREFDLLVDGKKIATQKLDRNRPEQFFDVVYPIPEELTKGKQSITVRFQALPGKTAGGVFDCRVLRKE